MTALTFRVNLREEPLLRGGYLAPINWLGSHSGPLIDFTLSSDDINLDWSVKVDSQLVSGSSNQ